jgi:D-psicose/D-tagatose/L-ribulose 3-epimerase
MKVSVCNIAWDHAELPFFLELLTKLGCHGIEIAPSRIWEEPVNAPKEERKKIRELIQGASLETTGFHSLLYNRPDLYWFRDRSVWKKTTEYMKRLSELCFDLGGKTLILGSPKNRRLHDRNYEDCLQWAAEAFFEIAEDSAQYGTILCLEPLSPQETDFISSSQEGYQLVQAVNHPHFQLHLDAKAMINSGENFLQTFLHCKPSLRHFHVGDPGLAPPGSTGFDHSVIGQALQQVQYDHYISIEMICPPENAQNEVRRSVKYVQQCYFKNKETCLS